MLRAGLVGAGNIGKFHVQGLRRLPGVEIVGVTDLNPERARQFGEEMSVAVYPSLAALREAGAQVIHVVTPPASHATIAIEAMRLGCDVLIEKPMATSVADCDRIERAAAEFGRKVCVGHSLLFDPFVRRALDMVRGGAIGEVISFDYYRSMNQQSYPVSGLTGEQQQGGYPFRDIGIHALYLAEAFVGPIRDIQGGPSASGRGDVNLWVDEWRVAATCERGAAHIHLSWNVRPQQNLLVIQGTAGVIRADIFGMAVTSRRQRPLPEHATRILNALGEGFGMAKQAVANVGRVATRRLWQFHGVQALIAEFYATLQSGGEAPVTPAEARRVLYWTEHIAQQGDALKAAWVASVASKQVPADTLVTGGGGYIGRQLVERLLSEGATVRLLLRRAPAAAIANHPRVEVMLGDLGDAEVVRRAVEGTSRVFHVGAAMRGSGPEFERSTVTGTRNVVESCLAAGVDRLIYMSSLAVIDTDAGPTITESSPLEQRPQDRGNYTKTKLDAERIVLDAVRDRGLRAVLLRPGEVVGAGKPLMTPGVAQRAGSTLVVIGNGKVRLPLVHVNDVVDAVFASAARDLPNGAVIQLVEDAGITQNDIIAHYRSTSRAKYRVLRIPLPAVLMLASVIEMIGKRVLGWAPIGPRRIRAATASRYFDCTVARTLLGWEPRAGVRSVFTGDAARAGAARTASPPLGDDRIAAA